MTAYCQPGKPFSFHRDLLWYPFLAVLLGFLFAWWPLPVVFYLGLGAWKLVSLTRHLPKGIAFLGRGFRDLLPERKATLPRAKVVSKLPKARVHK